MAGAEPSGTTSGPAERPSRVALLLWPLAAAVAAVVVAVGLASAVAGLLGASPGLGTALVYVVVLPVGFLIGLGAALSAVARRLFPPHRRGAPVVTTLVLELLLAGVTSAAASASGLPLLSVAVVAPAVLAPSLVFWAFGRRPGARRATGTEVRRSWRSSAAR